MTVVLSPAQMLMYSDAQVLLQIQYRAMHLRLCGSAWGWLFLHDPLRNPLAVHNMLMRLFVCAGARTSADEHQAQYVHNGKLLQSFVSLQDLKV